MSTTNGERGLDEPSRWPAGHIPEPGEPSVPEIEVDESIPPRPEEAIADTARAQPDVQDHAQHSDEGDADGSAPAGGRA